MGTNFELTSVNLPKSPSPWSWFGDNLDLKCATGAEFERREDGPEDYVPFLSSEPFPLLLSGRIFLLPLNALK
jgi:hypothetical protein